MSAEKQERSADILKPYRERIDALDRQIIGLLRARYDVIEKVGVLKAQHGIPAVLQDRVDEVRENAAADAVALGLDADFIRHLWAQLIEHSCALEDSIIRNKKT
ncbi:MAG: chorismate mutase [Alphaproteobacteria bacterium]|nr:chorismate mutase [Alphaproteobacteria bacterium]